LFCEKKINVLEDKVNDLARTVETLATNPSISADSLHRKITQVRFKVFKIMFFFFCEENKSIEIGS